MSDQMYEATLIRGRIYVYAGKRFENGKPLPVTNEEMAHLKANARDPVDIKEGDVTTQEWRQKFDFAPLDSAGIRESDPEEGPRVRARPQAA